MLKNKAAMEKKPAVEKFKEKYIQSTNKLGEGANGFIYECQSKRNGKQFALKILEMNTKSLREVELHFRTSVCENIVNFIDVFKKPSTGQLYLVIERMYGNDLFERLGEIMTFDEAAKADIMYQICNAVSFLHSNNIAHRDLKPENFLFAYESTDSILKLTDFGFAKICKSSEKSLTTPLGTKYFIGPEILKYQPYDKACDLWAIGVILYVILIGGPPFPSSAMMTGEVDDPNNLSPNMREKIMNARYNKPKKGTVSPEAMHLVESLLKVDPEERATIEDVIASSWIKNRSRNPGTPVYFSGPPFPENEKIWTSDMSRDLMKKLAEMRKNKPKRTGSNSKRDSRKSEEEFTDIKKKRSSQLSN